MAATKRMKAYASFDDYLANQKPRNQAIIRALRRFVKRAAAGLEESVKWGNGCWVDGKRPVAYVYSAPDYVQFGFFGGSAIEDPRGLLEGSGQYVRHIKVHSPSGIDESAFAALLKQAAGLPYPAKPPVKVKRKPRREGRGGRRSTSLV